MAALVQRKADRAARAREALKRQRALALGDQEAPDGCGWATVEHEAAARVQIFRPTLSSTSAAARFLAVERRWIQRLNVVAASSLLRSELEAFSRLLQEVELAKESAVISPISFVWSRMYDETPARSWTHVIGSAGEVQGQAAIAKIMACTLDFAMVLAITASQHREPSLAQQTRGQASGPAHVQAHAPQAQFVIRGSIGTKLVALSSQHGEVVLEAIQRSMSLAPEHTALAQKLFAARVVVRQTDLHRSQLAAERELCKQAPRWPSALFRCGMHRDSTLWVWMPKRKAFSSITHCCYASSQMHSDPCRSGSGNGQPTNSQCTMASHQRKSSNGGRQCPGFCFQRDQRTRGPSLRKCGPG